VRRPVEDVAGRICPGPLTIPGFVSQGSDALDVLDNLRCPAVLVWTDAAQAGESRFTFAVAGGMEVVVGQDGLDEMDEHIEPDGDNPFRVRRLFLQEREEREVPPGLFDVVFV
jgi:hypothetical protein